MSVSINKTNFQKNLYSTCWEENWGKKSVIAIQSDREFSYIEDFVQLNIHKMDSFFPTLLKSSRDGHIFYFVKITDSLRFDQLLSIKKMHQLCHLIDSSVNIGNILAKFHAEKWVIPEGRYNFESEFKERIDIVKKHVTLPENTLMQLTLCRDYFLSHVASQFIHHDFTPWNIFVKNSNCEITLIDYFDSRRGFFYEDIAKFLVSTMALSENPVKQFILKSVCKKFLSGYMSVSRLDDTALKKMIIIYLMFHISYQIKDGIPDRKKYIYFINQLLCCEKT